jgi:hypothetical protein
MAERQNFENHAQLVTGFHKILFPIILLTLIGSGVNLYQSWGDHVRLYSASLILVLVCISMGLFFYCRIFALKAQDRAIRAEESLRHYMMTGKALDSRLTVKQIVALRFASDAEFVALAERAAKESMEPLAIKKAIRDWRGDYYRV